MDQITRTFTVDQLEEIGVPFDCVEPGENNPDNLAVELHREQTDTRRWSSTHSLAFRAPDDGKTYRVDYQLPLTERQECDLWFDSDTIVAIEVETVAVTVQQWRPVKAGVRRAVTQDLNRDGAARTHYTDPRVRQLAEACWRLRTGGTRQQWLALGKNHPDALIREARDWMRAAVAAGILDVHGEDEAS